MMRNRSHHLSVASDEIQALQTVKSVDSEVSDSETMQTVGLDYETCDSADEMKTDEIMQLTETGYCSERIYSWYIFRFANFVDLE